jgi:hypothetical protein
VFGGYRQIETYDAGEITVWSKDDAPPAHVIPSDAKPASWEGLIWGILPIGSSILAILFVWLLVEPRRLMPELITIPDTAPEAVLFHEVRS